MASSISAFSAQRQDDDSTSEIQLYIPTTRTTKISLKPSEINPNLENNVKRAVERQFGNKFFSFGHVRPGTIKILKRSIAHKIGASDFTGKFNINVIFQCEVFLPQIGMEIDTRVKSINKIGILAKSDSNKLTVLLSKPHQSNLELFSEVMLESRIRARIMDFKINSQNETIVVIGDLTKILEGVYQNYQLPRVDGVRIDLSADIQPTPNIKNLYLNYGDFMDSINSKSLMDPYAMFQPDNVSMGEWNKMRRNKSWNNFKDYWHTVRSMVEDYELVYPSGGYNSKRGIAKLPFKSKPISRAFFKLWELFYRYREIMERLNTDSNMTILNLGEAPGGFVQATMHYRMKEYSMGSDTYWAYSLKPDDSGNSGISLSWENPTTENELSKFNNVINLSYSDHTNPDDLKKITEDLDGQKADLVTADGAFTGNKVYNYEEVVNYKIFFGEIVAALMNQKIGGSFVIKIFDILTQVTTQMMLLLNHYYSEIFITKPDFSRPASSEKYIICLGFKGLETNRQTPESFTNTVMEILKIWNEKIETSTDIYYPNNSTFLYNLLGYQIGDDEEFSRKLQEISRDHVMKQSDHITQGIHLIHTRAIFDKRQVERIKQNQLKQAVNWCQRYKLEYLENLDFSEEQFVHKNIVNIEDAEKYSLKTLDKDFGETMKYLNNEYQNVSIDYLRERDLALNSLLETIHSDYVNSEIYDFKAMRLNPAEVLNKELGLENSQRWYAVQELLTTWIGKPSKSKYNVFINLDSVLVDATLAIIDYFDNKTSTKLDWTGNIVWKENLEDPTGFIKESADKWIMGPTQDGSPSNMDNINFYSERYSGNKTKSKSARKKDKDESSADKVDLYFSDFHIPLDQNAYGILILDPETYFLKEYIGQIIIGLITLANGGDLIIRQYTWFREPTIGMITLLQELFDDVVITKPLIGPMENSETYLIAKGFKTEKFTDRMRDDLLEYVDNLTGNREELMEENEFGLLPYSLGLSDAKIAQTTEKLVYIGYRIYVLQQFPRLQINLDMFHHPTYSLNSAEMASVRNMLEQKQEIIENDEDLTEQDEQELIKINRRVAEIFKDITKKIRNIDFSYLVDDLAKNWLAKFEK